MADIYIPQHLIERHKELKTEDRTRIYLHRVPGLPCYAALGDDAKPVGVAIGARPLTLRIEGERISATLIDLIAIQSKATQIQEYTERDVEVLL